MARRRKRRSRSPQTKTTSGGISHGIGRRQVLTAVGGGAILGGVLIGLSVVNGRKDAALNEDVVLSSKPLAEISNASKAAPNRGQTSSHSKLSGTLLAHEKGNPDALVTVIDFSSYTCPHCRDFTLNTEPIIDKLYVSTRQILFSFRHSPLDDLAARAGEAVEAAGALGDFWGYHHELMERQSLLIKDRYSDVSLTAIASDLGLDTNKLREDIESLAITKEIQNNNQLANEIGITGTPAFIVGDELVPGVISADGLRQLILIARKGIPALRLEKNR